LSRSPQRARSDYKAGLCLTVTLFVLMTSVLVAMELGKRSAEEGPSFTISVPLEMGVEGVNDSSQIIYGGLVVGKVDRVEFDDDRILVRVTLNRRLQLKQSVEIVKQSSLLGGTNDLLIMKTGDDKDLKDLADGSTVEITRGASGVSSVLGPKGAKSVDDIITNIETSVDGFRSMAEDLGDNPEVEDIQRDFLELRRMIDEDLPRWERRYESLLGRIERISREGEMISAGMGRVEDSFGRTSEAVGRVESRLSPQQISLIEDAYRSILDSYSQVVDDFESETMPVVDRILETARGSIDDFERIVGEMQKIASRTSFSIDYALAQTTLASQQLSITLDEVITSLGIPLLQRPSQEEVGLMTRYAAFSEWASSAVQIKETLDSIREVRPLLPEDRLGSKETMDRLVGMLEQSLRDYESAQRRFVATTRGDPEPPGQLPQDDRADDQDR